MSERTPDRGRQIVSMIDESGSLRPVDTYGAFRKIQVAGIVRVLTRGLAVPPTSPPPERGDMHLLSTNSLAYRNKQNQWEIYPPTEKCAWKVQVHSEGGREYTWRANAWVADDAAALAAAAAAQTTADEALAGAASSKGRRPVLAVGQNDPPGAPVDGTAYVIGTGTGAWAGHDGEYVARTAGAWVFEAPQFGWMVSNQADQKNYTYLSAGWVQDDAVAIGLANAAGAAALAAATDAATALVAANEADDTADAAQSSANVALFELAIGVNPATVRHIYVDPFVGVGATGNDANDGTTSATAIQSYARLLELLPAVIDQPTLVHLASGTLTIGTQPIPHTQGTRILCFQADEAWDPRGDLYTIDLAASGVAGVGTNANTLVAPSALTANAHRGQHVRFTSGAAATTQRRTFSGNTTTNLTPCLAFSPAPAAGDSYEVFTSNAVIAFTSIQPVTADSVANTHTSGVAFVGVEFSSTTNAVMNLGKNYHQFYGCRVRGSCFGPFLGDGGCIDSASISIALASQFGLPNNTWNGWCLVTESSGVSSGPGVSSAGRVEGMFVVKGGCNWGGVGIISPRGGFFGSIALIQQAMVTITGPSATLPTIIGEPGTTGTKLTVQAGNCYMNLSSNTSLNNSDASNPVIDVTRGGRLNVNTSITGLNANASGILLRVRRGGNVSISGAPNAGFGRSSGNPDLQCEGNTQLKTVLSAVDTNILDATKPYSSIFRAA